MRKALADLSLKYRDVQRWLAESMYRLRALDDEERTLHREIEKERRKRLLLKQNRRQAILSKLSLLLPAHDRGRSLQEFARLKREGQLLNTYGPIAAITKVKSRQFLPYVEHVLKSRFAAYICVDSEEDVALLSEKGLHALYLRPELKGRVVFPTATDYMKSLGVLGFLQEEMSFDLDSDNEEKEEESAHSPHQDDPEMRKKKKEKEREEKMRLARQIRETILSFTSANLIFIVREDISPEQEKYMQNSMKNELAKILGVPHVSKLVYYKGSCVYTLQKSRHDHIWTDTCDTIPQVLYQRRPNSSSSSFFSSSRQGGASENNFESILRVCEEEEEEEKENDVGSSLENAHSSFTRPDGGPGRVGEQQGGGGRGGGEEEEASKMRKMKNRDMEEAFKRRQEELNQQRAHLQRQIKEFEKESENISLERQKIANERSLLTLKNTKIAEATHNVDFAKQHYDALLTQVQELQERRPGKVELLLKGQKLHQAIWTSLSHSLRQQREAAKALHAVARKLMVLKKETSAIDTYRQQLATLYSQRKDIKAQ
ncbi:smc n terminal domain-containing protein, partial [Cystoisospora suis]